MESSLKKSVSTAAVTKSSSHSQDLLGLFASDANFDSPGEPGEKTESRLDSSAASQLSKEVSDLLSDITWGGSEERLRQESGRTAGSCETSSSYGESGGGRTCWTV